MAIKTIAVPYRFTFLFLPITLSSPVYSTGCEHSPLILSKIVFVNIERKRLCTGALALVTINYEEIAKFSLI
jgi:hypothetical protein